MTIALATLETNLYSKARGIATANLVGASNTFSNSNQIAPIYTDDISHKFGFPVMEIQIEIENIENNRMGGVQKADCNILFLVVEDNAADSKASNDNIKITYLQNKASFKDDGFHNIKIIGGGNTRISKNNKHYHYKRFTISGEYREKP